jgi:hypothetical protein
MSMRSEESCEAEVAAIALSGAGEHGSEDDGGVGAARRGEGGKAGIVGEAPTETCVTAWPAMVTVTGRVTGRVRVRVTGRVMVALIVMVMMRVRVRARVGSRLAPHQSRRWHRCRGGR